jgi:hypothetical protein
MPRYPLNYAGAFRHTQPPLSMSLLVISRAIFLSFTLLLLLLMTIILPHDPTHPARRADLALITHSGAHSSTILIDVTIAAHNSRAAGRAASYARDYRPPPDDVQLLFFSVETSGFIHRMVKDFLKRLLASSNTAYLQALQSISVALQSA